MKKVEEEPEGANPLLFECQLIMSLFILIPSPLGNHAVPKKKL